MKNDVKLSVLGCCASRDVFGLHENEGGYVIKRYVQNVSPISLVTKPPLIRKINKEDEYIFDKTSDFYRKCQLLELNKSVLSYLSQDVVDYFIFDVAEFRRRLYYFAEIDAYFSQNYLLRGLYEEYVRKGIVSDEYELIDPLEIERNKLEYYLKKYCDLISDLYSIDRIILVDIRASKHHKKDIEDNFLKEDIKLADVLNQRIVYAFDLVRDYMEGIHVIEFPEYTPLEDNHKWGKNALHYSYEYYDYVLEAIDIITSEKLSMDSEIQVLIDLKKKYEELFYSKYFNSDN